jgi:hypothetical protein
MLCVKAKFVNKDIRDLYAFGVNNGMVFSDDFKAEALAITDECAMLGENILAETRVLITVNSLDFHCLKRLILSILNKPLLKLYSRPASLYFFGNCSPKKLA